MNITAPCVLRALAQYSLQLNSRSSSLSATILAAILLTLPALSETRFDSLSTSVFSTDPHTFVERLEKHRQPVNAEFKAAAVASFEAILPQGGEIKNLSPAEKRKLLALSRVLEIHRRDSVYEIRVITLPQSAIGLYQRVVVWISWPALDLLNAEDLQGAVAHEVGHDYLWEETRSAQESKDHRRLQDIELFCDAVGIMTLTRAGLSPSHMFSGVKKMAEFNQKRFGTPLNVESYPNLAGRQTFARKVIRWAARTY